jgi:hypothetical protein
MGIDAFVDFAVCGAQDNGGILSQFTVSEIFGSMLKKWGFEQNLLNIFNIILNRGNILLGQSIKIMRGVRNITILN